jgi:hypothetical protein
MGEDKVDVRKLNIPKAPDLQTQLESLLDCVWREERFEKEMDRIEANCRVFDSMDKNSRNI